MRFLTSLIFVLLLVITSESEVIYVPDDYNSISAAYNDIDASDTICLRKGIYYDNILIGYKAFTLLSEYGQDSTVLRSLDPQYPVIHGDGEEFYLGQVFIRGITFDSLTANGIIDLNKLGGIGLAVDSVSFHFNDAGTLINIGESRLTVTNTDFSENNSALIYVNGVDPKNIAIEGCHFIGNQSHNLFNIVSDSCTFSNNLFNANTSDTLCWLSSGSFTYIEDNQFIQNQADVNISLNYICANSYIIGNIFHENSGGSCLSFNNSSSLIRSNQFEDNNGGSAVEVIHGCGEMTIDSNHFIGNTDAVHGAGIYLCRVEGVVSENLFYQNNADFGSGIYVDCNGLENLDISHNSFISNTADSSAILYHRGGAGNIEYNNFDSNQVSSGAIFYFSNEGPSTVPLISYNSLTNNILDSGYAMMWLKRTRKSCSAHGNFIYNNIISQGDGSALAFTNPEKSIYASDNLIIQNQGCTGLMAIPNVDFGLEISCNNVWENTYGEYQGFESDSTNISADPLLCNPESGDYSLCDISPCLPQNNTCEINIGPYEQGCYFASVIDVQLEDEVSIMNVVNHLPVLIWSDYSYHEFVQTRYEIEVGIDENWDIAEMWDSPIVYTSQSSTQYDGLPLIDGQTYFLRIRIGDSSYWSDWYQIEFRLNTAPSVPQPLIPTDSSMTDAMPVFYLSNSTDPENNSLFYYIEVRDDSDQIAALSPIVSESDDSSHWQCGVGLAENQMYKWRVKAFDGYEESDWSDYNIFFINTENDAPSEFELIYPPDSSQTPLADLSPLFQWSESIDSDPFDSLTYTLFISTDSNFSIYSVIAELSGTQTELPFELERGTCYWWKVRSTDLHNSSTWSTGEKKICMMICGDTNADRDVSISDAVVVINFVFSGGMSPAPIEAGDANCDGSCNLSDAYYLILFAFQGGNPPCDINSDGIPEC